jgi:prophage regulatory protein
MPERLLSLPKVQDRVPYSKAMIYALVNRNEFPQPIPIGARRVAWRESEIDGWISDKIVAARGESARPEASEPVAA